MLMKKVVTRFAPSPTGYLHIGSARTALFNYLFAKHHKGKYLLRIEDTDRERSTEQAVRAIIEGLSWMGLEADEAPIFQFSLSKRHAEVALSLLQQNKAYYCYCTPEELDEMREKARAEGRSPRYDGTWRDRDPKEAPSGIKPTLRLKAPLDGETKVNDLVQGEVTLSNQQLDDMVLLRGDGTPTYMLSVVVDDHDMGITHVIRGDDHFTNTFRQIQLYNALGWEYPEFAHIPLIHGSDGAKLSKRHGALGVEAYRDMGILPEAMCNYLLRLGWGHGDDEIISKEQAIAWFDVSGIGKSPSRLDMAKLFHINQHYMKQQSNEKLLSLLEEIYTSKSIKLHASEKERMLRGMNGLKPRAQNLVELSDQADIYRDIKPIKLEDQEQLIEMRPLLSELYFALSAIDHWTQESIEDKLKTTLTEKGIKFGKIGPLLRLVLTGKTAAPGVFEILYALGKEEALLRMKDQL